MKKIIIFLCLIVLVNEVFAQLPGDAVGNAKTLADTTLFYSRRTDGRGNELVIRNSTDTVLGILVNRKLGGLSTWSRSERINDSSFRVGNDTITLGHISGTRAVDTAFVIDDSTIRVCRNDGICWDLLIKGGDLLIDCPGGGGISSGTVDSLVALINDRVDSIWRVPGIDSIYWSKNGVTHAQLDSAGNLEQKISGTLDIYHENVEWLTSVSGAEFDAASATFPCLGAVSIEGTTVGNNDFINFDAPSVPDYTGYNYLVFKISSKATWTFGQRLRFRWINGSTALGVGVNFTDGSYGFKSNITDSCQLIYIPLAAFGNITGADRLHIEGSINTSGTIGFFIDDIVLLQSNVSPQLSSAITWDQTMTNSPDIHQDYFSHFNSTTWTLDSITQLNIHVTNWVDIIGDKDAGREYIMKGHVNDNPNSIFFIGNSTHINGAMHPMTGGYLDQNALNVEQGAYSVRGITHSSNDVLSTGTPVIQFVVVTSDNETDPNAAPLYAVHNQNVFGVGDSDLQFLMIKASGQLQLPMYVGGDFAGTAAYGLGVDVDGNVIVTDAVGGGGSTPTWEQTLDVTNGDKLTISHTIDQQGNDLNFYTSSGQFQSFIGDVTFTADYSRILNGTVFYALQNQDNVADINTNIIGTLASGGQVNIQASSSVSANAISLQAGGNAMSFNQSSGNYLFLNVVEFANNAAAITGGLAIGTLYRNGDNVQIVH